MMTIDQTPPNHARARAKTQIRSFCKGKKWFKSLSLKIKMRPNQNVSVDFLLCWACREFSHSLALAANPAIILRLQSTPLASRRAGSLGGSRSQLIRNDSYQINPNKTKG